ncbi:hypothetical protein BT96DRAFT_950222 [Gymnopus androsaceus JB14]|uniref:Uncharacterized protein n=1 Tax=Gymnopus androsaceus JB14 TaxID=1447944 RepID=A0A6A4GHG7_9AGAR|nr:hypothetical protein BT96DRAFT_950222 [Gymnopus androsaceus JB14]
MLRSLPSLTCEQLLVSCFRTITSTTIFNSKPKSSKSERTENKIDIVILADNRIKKQEMKPRILTLTLLSNVCGMGMPGLAGFRVGLVQGWAPGTHPAYPTTFKHWASAFTYSSFIYGNFCNYVVGTSTNQANKSTKPLKPSKKKRNNIVISDSDEEPDNNNTDQDGDGSDDAIVDTTKAEKAKRGDD